MKLRLERGKARLPARVTAIAADRFEVPEDYRFQEPDIVRPVRKRP